MTFNCLLFSGAWLLVLVNPHPLQNIQPHQIINHQHAYQPYSEAFFVQPSDTNLYSQPLRVQTPFANYQPASGPSLTDQIRQLIWDKIYSDPSLCSLLDPKLSFDQTHNGVKTKLHPCNTGGVVNNYIIVPPDFTKLNETVHKPKTEAIKKESKGPVKENINENKGKLTGRKSNKKNKSRRKQQERPETRDPENAAQKWNFNTDNIKCFTPVDVLKNEKYQPKRSDDKIKEVKKQSHNSNCNKKSTTANNCENKNKSHKIKNTKTNKVRNTSVERSNAEYRKKTDKDIFSPNNSLQRKKQEQRNKKELNVCDCPKNENLSEKTKADKDVSQFCEQDIEDLLLSTLLQQSCPILENRCTRNSKTDTAKKDLHSMYPAIPGDYPNTFNWYVNDLYSPHSLQQALNFNAFQGNKYPFDFSQIYQIPQYSNADLNKSKENTERNKNTKRKKKKKKSKTRKENVSTSDDINSSQFSNSRKNVTISEINTQIPEVNTDITEIHAQNVETSTLVSEIIIHAPEVSTDSENMTLTNDECTENTTNMNRKLEPHELSPSFTEKISTETMRTTTITSLDKVVEYFKETPEDKILQTRNENLESEQEDSKEIYETQIPYSVIVNKEDENNTELPISEEIAIDEMLPILGFDDHGFGSEDEFYKMFMKDYYPDFRADNHAYLFNGEQEYDVDDRYFYVTDKNINSEEISSAEEANQLYAKGIMYNDNKLQTLDTFKQNEDRDKLIEDEKSQEILFQTPPGLDNPDFMTQKINRETKDSDEIYYPHSFDDFDNFDSLADKLDNYETAKKNNNSGRIVETVYAKSKVVKYGQGQELNRHKPEVKASSSNDGIDQNDGKTMVVIATSLPGEFW